jgi:5-methylcytosine-specific restriction endonuclease McrA
MDLLTLYGGIKKRKGPIPKELRLEILERDNNECQWGINCSTSKKIKLNVHHRDCNPDNNEKNNLITLCPRCHRFYHSTMDKRIRKEVVKRFRIVRLYKKHKGGMKMLSTRYNIPITGVRSSIEKYEKIINFYGKIIYEI